MLPPTLLVVRSFINYRTRFFSKRNHLNTTRNHILCFNYLGCWLPKRRILLYNSRKSGQILKCAVFATIGVTNKNEIIGRKRARKNVKGQFRSHKWSLLSCRRVECPWSCDRELSHSQCTCLSLVSLPLIKHASMLVKVKPTL